MKPVKITALLLIMCFCVITLSGCWNYQDIEKISIVSGFSLDKNPQDNTYILTVELVDFEMLGKDAKQTNKYVESQGKTVFDAIRNIIDFSGKKLYWAHASIVILGEDIAKEGILPAIDLMLRDAEMREEMYVFISKDQTAKEALKQGLLTSQSSSDNLQNMIDNEKKVGNSYGVRMYQLIEPLESDGISISLPTLKLKDNMGKKTAAVDGIAAFKSDKLVGYLDEHQTKFFLFAINKIDKGLLTLKESSQNGMDDITLEIFKASTKVKPVIKNKKLEMEIKIKLEAALAEVGTSVDYAESKNSVKIKKDAEAYINTSVEDVIKKIQSEFDSDILGFGMHIKADMPSVWKEAKRKNTDLFKTLKVNIKTEIKITNSALGAKTIQKGD